MVNPFEYKDLISISSGCVALKDTRDHLITAYIIGQNGAKSFVEDRMTSETDKILNPIKTNYSTRPFHSNTDNVSVLH